MRAWITALYFSVFVTVCFGQDSEATSEPLKESIQWLKDKLTYNYYNESDSEWWLNRFSYNTKSQTITIKNIASPRLESVSDKTYLQLNFRLEELNPFSIQIQKNTSNMGRLVKGKVIRVEAYEKVIKRVKNGRLTTNQSFIYVSVPAFMEDSLEQFSQSIAHQLERAITLATKVHNKGTEANIITLRKLLLGKFTDGAETTWDITEVFTNTFEIRVLHAEALVGIKYLSTGETLKMTVIAPGLSEHWVLQARKGQELAYAYADKKITFVSQNKVIWNDGMNSTVLLRD